MGMISSASDYLTLRCRSVPLRQSLWCRSVPIGAATISGFRHLTAPNGTQRHLSAPKTFFSRFPAGQIGKQTVKFSNSSSLKAPLRTVPLAERLRPTQGIKPNQTSGEYSSECARSETSQAPTFCPIFYQRISYQPFRGRNHFCTVSAPFTCTYYRLITLQPLRRGKQTVRFPSDNLSSFNHQPPP